MAVKAAFVLELLFMRFAVNCNEYLVKYIGPMGHAMSRIVYADSKQAAAQQIMYSGFAERVVSVAEV